VQGYSVTFVTGSVSGTLSGATQNTDASGVATVGDWTLGTAATETVSVTVAGLTGSPVTFTANVTAQFDLAVNITDNRDFVQYGRTLDYVIVVSNSGPSTANNTVTDNLPPELDNSSSSWVCFSHTTGATCTDKGSGDLADTPSIPAGGSVTYVLSATVRSDPNAVIETVVNQVSVDATDDSNSTNNTATSTTTVVIFRDGFEAGGDGSQRANGVFQPLATLDGLATLSLDTTQTSLDVGRPVPWIRALDAQNRLVFRIDMLRDVQNTLVRIVNSDANGNETASAWMSAQSLVLGVAGAVGRYEAMVSANAGSLQAAMPSWAVLPLQVYAAQ
jgi:uncharacterized repeat protein (TIGR01451 family)